MSELVEWLVGYRDEDGKLQCLTAGAQSVFGRSRAEKLVSKLGLPWQVLPLDEALREGLKELRRTL